MMFKWLRQYSVFLFLLVFPAICILFYNTLFNVHSHHLKNGVVTHAHHYTKNSESGTPVNHTHNSSDIVLLDKIFYFFFFLIVGILLVSIIFYLHKETLRFFPSFQLFNTINLPGPSRAPPFQF